MSRKLSVIVPAYKASEHISENLVRLEEELKTLNRPYEVIVVCDGCQDTFREAVKNSSENLKVFSYEHNMGKGYALKYGAVRTTGELVTFIDADMSIDPHEIDTFIKLMDIYASDIVIGSKRHPQSNVHYPLFRRMQSVAYQMLITMLFQINVKDTQAGLKLFRRDVLLKVLPRVLVKAYAFDLEILVVAHRLGYKKVLEAPIEIKQQFSTTTNLRAAWRVLLDTAAIFYRSRILKYYDRDHIFIEVAESEPSVSIIIPVKEINDYVGTSVRHLHDLGYRNYEVIIFPDEGQKPADFPEEIRVIPSGPIGPAEKRDLSLKYADGSILAFLDDDAYPRADWLINAARHFHNNDVAAVVGPAVTPDDDDVRQQASGAVLESRLGAGTLTYRYVPKGPREVYDFPSVNLLIRKNVFSEVGGFDTHYWPGEDTKLCLDVVNLGKKIIYDPDVLVWHHRRRLFGPHLKQIAGYAEHRGYFAKTYPRTSLKLAYFVPSLFVVGLAGGIPLAIASKWLAIVYLLCLTVYATAVVFSAAWVAFMKNNLKVGLLFIPGIVSTHITYGVYFMKGLFMRELKQ
ncbi:MAG: glycosyltransferase [Actinomycetota bacterium]